MKYVYVVPRGGMSDMFSRIMVALEYCEKTGRVLLLDGEISYYKINFSKYFEFSNKNIIYDTDKIREIISNSKLTIYPSFLQDRMMDVINKKVRFKWSRNNGWAIETSTKTMMSLPDELNEDDIIVCSGSKGPPPGYALFEQLKFTPIVKEYLVKQYNKMSIPYLCIQVRNTDHKCDYKQLYNDNKERIHSYEQIFLSTDSKEVINYFASQGVNFINFTTFPKNSYSNLHTSRIDSHTKIMDVLCDIYIASMSDNILSISKGHFIVLMRTCFDNKELLRDKINT